MITGTAPPHYRRLSLGISLALHLAALAVFVAIADLEHPGTPAANEQSVVPYPLQIEHAVRRLVAHPLRPHALALTPARPALAPTPARPAPATPKNAAAPRIVVRAPALPGDRALATIAPSKPAPHGRGRAREQQPAFALRPADHPAERVAPRAQTNAYAPSAARANASPVAGASTPPPVATPAVVAQNDAAAAPVATRAPARTVAFVSAANGGWAQNYPARLTDGGTLPRIAALAGAHFHVRVTVDENGSPTGIEFLSPLPDQTRSSIEARLMTLRYLPAECSGMRCSGSIDLSG